MRAENGNRIARNCSVRRVSEVWTYTEHLFSCTGRIQLPFESVFKIDPLDLLANIFRGSSNRKSDDMEDYNEGYDDEQLHF